MGGLPIILVAALSTMSSNVGEAMKGLFLALGLTWALFQYGVLAIRTTEQKKYRFGFYFWLAVGAASIGTWWAGVSFGFRAAALVIGPVALATLYFIAIQLRIRKESTPAPSR